MRSRFIAPKWIISFTFILAIGTLLPTFLSSNSAKATVLPTSDTSPTITKVDRFPDANTIRVHWNNPTSDSGTPITDYAYLLQGGNFTSATYVFMQQGYTVVGNDFSFTLSGLIRCDCIQYSIQIASVRGGQIIDPSRSVGVSFTAQDPALSLTPAISTSDGFTFKVNDWLDPSTYNLYDYSGKQNYYPGMGPGSQLPISVPPFSYTGPGFISEQPFMGPVAGDMIYGPSVYKLTGVFGSDIQSVKVGGPDSTGMFTVSGVPKGAKVGVTIAKHPVNCSNYYPAYCSETVAATVWGTTL